MTGDAEDRSKWTRDGQIIRRAELLRLIEENGGPKELDLRGTTLLGDGTSSDFRENPIDLSREALRPLAAAYRQTYGADPPWFSDFTQGVNLWRARLEAALLMRARLTGADFSEAKLQGALLGATDLQQAKFLMANLEGANFVDAGLQGVDFYFAESITRVQWFSAFLDRTRMRREQLGKATRDETNAATYRTAKTYLPASEAFLALKHNFLSVGRYGDAAWAYIKERQMEKMAYHWAWREHGWCLWRRYQDDSPPDWPGQRVWKFGLLWLRSWVYELLTGYGERPWLPLVWAIAVVGSFAIGYAAAGNISPDFAGDPATAHGSHNFVDALTHSIGAFATIGFNTLEPLGWGARLLTAIESALGISLFALFIFTLGNRMSRS